MTGRLIAAALALVMLESGCGGNGRAVGAGSPDRALVAASLPRVTYHGGPYLRSPRVVTVTFRGDDPRLVASLRRFGDLVTRTRWWSAVIRGYCTRSDDCIGPGRRGRHVELASPLAGSLLDVDVGALLAPAAAAGSLGLLDRETLLLVYLPKAVSLGDAFFPRYCGAGRPRAVHRLLRLASIAIPYAVVPRCGGEAALTATASHEILEAVTNPDPSRRGFAFVRTSPTLGFTASGVEPADPCGLLNGTRRLVRERGLTFQRAWSNQAAARGQDPCVPAHADGRYLALVPDTPVVRPANLGDPVTIRLRARADRAVRRWAASAHELARPCGRRSCVDIALDRTTVEPGTSARLTITLRRRPADGGLVVVGVESKLGADADVWPIAVLMESLK